MDKTITFIGGGNMAQALLGGLLNSGHAPKHLRAADPSAEQREKLERLGIAAFADNAEAVRGADVVVLAVKPQVMDAVLPELKSATDARRLQARASLPSAKPPLPSRLRCRPAPERGQGTVGRGAAPDEQKLADAAGAELLFISIAAGITLERLGRTLGADSPMVRAMPNTPALYGCGVTGLAANPNVDAAGKAMAETILGTAGEIIWVESEALMDAVTAVSGSGPAYFFLLTEALTDAAIQQGLPPATARTLATRTAFGAGTMLAKSDVDAAELRRRVTSPGGTTQAALETMEAAGLRETIQRAVDAAVRRGRELGL